jgi:hypothetical protein
VCKETTTAEPLEWFKGSRIQGVQVNGEKLELHIVEETLEPLTPRILESSNELLGKGWKAHPTTF